MTHDPSRQQVLAVVAEDEPLLRMEIGDLLTDEGFEVIEATNAEQAMRHLERLNGVAVLFTDIRMPGPQDGIALAREVAVRWPDTRIVVCSALFNPDLSALPEGAHFFSKPFLHSAVAQVLRLDL